MHVLKLPIAVAFHPKGGRTSGTGSSLAMSFSYGKGQKPWDKPFCWPCSIFRCAQTPTTQMQHLL